MKQSIKVKCVLLGTESSGKSSLVYRCIDNSFNKSVESTIGCSFNTKKYNLNERNVTLEIWDTGGSECYNSLLPMYYRNATIIIICVDLSKYFNKNILNTWVDDIDEYVDIGSKIVYIVGTKSDIKNDTRKKTLDNALMQYPEFTYMETSAKNDINVVELFNSCSIKIINREKELEKNLNNNFDINEILLEKETNCFNRCII